jgi:hypothetical protein
MINLDHNSDGVLTKKKLDELVRQVTGGGQGEGECLASDVETVCLPSPFPRIFIPSFDLPTLEPICPIYWGI